MLKIVGGADNLLEGIETAKNDALNPLRASFISKVFGEAGAYFMITPLSG
jgi:hypothetical protein